MPFKLLLSSRLLMKITLPFSLLPLIYVMIISWVILVIMRRISMKISSMLSMSFTIILMSILMLRWATPCCCLPVILIPWVVSRLWILPKRGNALRMVATPSITLPHDISLFFFLSLSLYWTFTLFSFAVVNSTLVFLAWLLGDHLLFHFSLYCKDEQCFVFGCSVRFNILSTFVYFMVSFLFYLRSYSCSFLCSLGSWLVYYSLPLELLWSSCFVILWYELGTENTNTDSRLTSYDWNLLIVIAIQELLAYNRSLD